MIVSRMSVGLSLQQWKLEVRISSVAEVELPNGKIRTCKRNNSSKLTSLRVLFVRRKEFSEEEEVPLSSEWQMSERIPTIIINRLTKFKKPTRMLPTFHACMIFCTIKKQRAKMSRRKRLRGIPPRVIRSFDLMNANVKGKNHRRDHGWSWKVGFNWAFLIQPNKNVKLYWDSDL